MKKFLQVIGSLIYSNIFAYLIWLGLHYIIPYLINLKISTFVSIIFIFYTTIYVLFMIVPSLLFVPLIFLCKENIIAKILSTIPLLIFCYCSCADPWHLSNLNTLKIIYIIIITLSITIPTYFTFTSAIWSEND